MSETALHVPTLPQQVTLVLVTGDEEEVTVFLADAVKEHGGNETLDDFLNTERRFFPVRRKSGHHALVRRSAVVVVRVDADSPLISRRESETMPAIDLVRVRLDNGTELDGVLLHVDPAGHDRLSDTFNGESDFFALEVGRGYVYVNKKHVVSLSL
jgi:hypothetical protein